MKFSDQPHSAIRRTGYPLFRKLGPHGEYFTQVNPANGLRILRDAAAARAVAHPAPFGHWYVDGGEHEVVSTSSLITISYGGLEPVRRALLRRIEKAINGCIGGPEALVTMLHKMRPEEIGLTGTPGHEF